MTHPFRVARLAPLLLCPLLPRLALAQPAKFTQDAITLRQDPSLPTDAVRKAYVDSLVGPVSAAVAAAQATASGAVPQSQLGQPNGPARLGPAGTLPVAQLPVGTAAGTVAAGNDPRILGAVQAGSLAPVATSGSYGDLTGKPAIPPAPVAGTTAGTFAAGNDPRIAGALQPGSLAPVATSGNYADLTGKPAIPTVPAFGTSAGTAAQGNDARIVGAIQAGSLAPVATSGSYADLSGKPVIPPAPVAGTGPGTFAAGNDTRITGAAQASALAPVATSGAYGSLSGLPVIPTVPAFGTGAGTVAQGNDVRIPVVGNQTGGVGSMVVDLLHESGAFALKDEAGIWGSANVRAYMGVSRTFNPGEGAANGPVAALFAFTNNNGSAADVVAVLGSAVARTSNTGSVFGANFIARTAAGVNAKLVGLEVDVEPAAGTTASAGSGGVFINAYSSAVPGPAILIGGLGGGTFSNGVQCNAIAPTGSCLAPQVGSTMRTMMDSTVATLNDAAIRIGPISAGTGQRIALRGSDALDAVITTDTNKFLKIAVGTNGVVFTNQPQTANLLLLSGSNGDLTLPINGGKLNGTGDLILNATTGQVNLLTGVKLATRTVTAGASDTALASDATIKWVKATGSASAQGIPACVSAIRGRVLAVKDGKGDAATNPITVTPAAGTIDGAASTIVNTARGAVTLQCDGSGDWSVLARL